jgi:molybdate transport system substrate-binding protein
MSVLLTTVLAGCAAPVTSTVTSTLTTSLPQVTSTMTSTYTSGAPPVTSTVTATNTTTSVTTSVVTTATTQTTTVTATSMVKSPVIINVAAASSLTNVLNELNALYTQKNPWVTITPNFGSSGTLQTQIQNGAPADIFLSAAESNMDTLQKAGLIVTDTRKDLLTNSIVLIVPLNSTLNITSFKDLINTNVKIIAIGDPKSVPAGAYATAAFDELGITAQVEPKEVMGSNVTQVLNYVETGNADAGIVYLTDALSSTRVKVVATGPADVNATIAYPVAVVKASKVQGDAVDYENFLFSAQAKPIFLKYGFNVVSR